MSVTFRDRFDALTESLEAHPKIEIHGRVLRPPASADDLSAAEAFLGMPLPDELREFYQAHDGVFLAWGIRGAKVTAVSPFGYPDYGHPPGIINLLPIAAVMSASWERSSHVNEVSAEHQARVFGAELDPPPPAGAVCIDNFAIYNHGDLLLGPKPVVIVSTDHGADMEASDWVSFATYLDMCLGLYGTSRYSNGIGIGWTREARYRETWEATKSLDELVDELVAEAEDA